MSVNPRGRGIEPALKGTRYGAALEGAETDRRERAAKEARLKADWVAAHPECGFSTPVNSLRHQTLVAAAQLVEIVEGSPYSEDTWAAFLEQAPKRYFMDWPPNATTLRRILQEKGFVLVKPNGKNRYKFQITPQGFEWLQARKLRALELQQPTQALLEDEEGRDES